MSSLEELQSNMKQYKTQLQQVKSLLFLDPNNEQYLRLQGDLADAIKLTQDLIDQSKVEASTVPSGELQLRKGDWIPKVGDRVEALWGEKKYPAVIIDLVEDGSNVTIRYYGYTDVQTKTRGEIQPLNTVTCLEPGVASVGYECEAKWVGDGQWYEAVILNLVENGYKVKFTKYGNETEVPLEYLRARQAGGAAGAAAGAGSRPPKRPAEDKKEFVIPENLRLLPTDTEEERARKRKKVKILKTTFKQKQQHEEEEQSRNWKSFLNKSGKKPKSMGALRKGGSIFASPDSVDGKVGVVNSGKGVTAFQNREKFKPKVK